MKILLRTFTLAFILAGFVLIANTCNKKSSVAPQPDPQELEQYPRIVFAGGCFWCIQAAYDKVPGIQGTYAGYAYDKTQNSNASQPTYEKVTYGEIQAREAVMVYYDANEIYLADVLDIFWRNIDPTDTGGQFADRGHHYTTAIYYTNAEQKKQALDSRQHIAKLTEIKKKGDAVSTKIVPLKDFAVAEEYHQNYKQKNPAHYERYERGSGRSGFIKSFWNKISKEKTNPNSDSSTHDWEDGKLEATTKIQRIKKLDPLSKYVTQHDGTERPYDNKYWDHKEDGIYVDVVSGEPLFLSKDKFDSNTGWPSFTKPIQKKYITEKKDDKLGLGMERIEVRSKVGDSHLGHIFNDGPREHGGQRYCINSAALRFVKKEDMIKEGYAEYLPELE